MIPKISAVSYRNTNVQKNANMAVSRPSFSGNTPLYEVKPTELRVENLLDLNKSLTIWATDIEDKSLRKAVFADNQEGVEFERNNDGSSTNIVINSIDKKNNKTVIGKINVADTAYPPILTYKQGKFKPEITVKHPELNGSRVKLLAGSELVANDFSIKMPGSYTTEDNSSRNISFAGDVALTTLQLEERTRNAVDLYLKSQLYNKITPGAYKKDVAEYEPNFVVPAGGVGSRFYNITRHIENKPSATMPTDKGYRVMGTTLNMLSAAGALNDDSIGQIKYISQKGDINGANVFHTQKYNNDGGAIAEALAQKAVDNTKDTIILNADIFSNADITRAYHALKTLPQAALVIPYYPVNPERAKSFGLLGTQQDKDGNLLLKEFVEKPKYTDIAPNREDFKSDEEFAKIMANYEKAQTARLADGQFLANPGMYVMSKEASEVLKNMKVLFDGETFQNNKTGDARLGLGADVMPKIVSLCNKGLLRNDKGEVMKAYTVPLQRPDGQNAFWDDIGSAEAFLKVVKDVARETKKTGTGTKNKFYGVPEFVLKDFTKNTDLKSGVVYQSDSARKNLTNFADKISLKAMNGNVYVVD